jgi:hypothetical protein
MNHGVPVRTITATRELHLGGPGPSEQGGEQQQQDEQQQRRRALRKERKRARRRVAASRKALQDIDQAAWIRRRGLSRRHSFTREQKRMLRNWFNSIDNDGSGNIDERELEEALVSTGVCKHADEVGEIFRRVDHDGSGEIGFVEFLEVLQPPHAVRPQQRAQAHALARLRRRVDRAHGEGMGVESMVGTRRRQLLLAAIIGDPAREERADRAVWAANASVATALRAHDARAPALKEALGEKQRAWQHQRAQKRQYVGFLANVVERGAARTRRQALLVPPSSSAEGGGGDSLPKLPSIVPPERQQQKEAAARERAAAMARLQARKERALGGDGDGGGGGGGGSSSKKKGAVLSSD